MILGEVTGEESDLLAHEVECEASDVALLTETCQCPNRPRNRGRRDSRSHASTHASTSPGDSASGSLEVGRGQ